MRFALFVVAVLGSAPAWAQDPMGSWPEPKLFIYNIDGSYVSRSYGPVTVHGPAPRPQAPAPRVENIEINIAPPQTQVVPAPTPYYRNPYPYRVAPFRHDHHPQTPPQGEVYRRR